METCPTGNTRLVGGGVGAKTSLVTRKSRKNHFGVCCLSSYISIIILIYFCLVI